MILILQYELYCIEMYLEIQVHSTTAQKFVLAVILPIYSD